MPIGKFVNRRSNARGAVVIHVAIALAALLSFVAFSLDQGVMLVSRRQAQNAADSGALAGAVTLLYNLANYTEARLTAQQFASQNPIWGAATAYGDITVHPLPFTCPPSAGGGNACIRVDVMRGQPDAAFVPHTNYLPMYFGYLFGLQQQGVRATATAQVGRGNAVRCIKPWVVADKWTDTSGTGIDTGGWDQSDFYNPGQDTYAPTGFAAEGTPNDYGLQLVLKSGDIGTWSAGWTREIEFPGCPGNSSDCYRDELMGCPAWVPEVGLYDGQVPCSSKDDTPVPEKGCVGIKPGMSVGPTRDGVETIVGRDEDAVWNTTTNSIDDGCMEEGTCTLSPRVVPLAIFNTGAYVALAEGQGPAGCSGSTCVAQVVNLLGFFVEGFCDEVYPVEATRPPYCGTPAEAGKAVVGRLMAYPGQASGVAGSAGPETFLRVVRLVQ